MGSPLVTALSTAHKDNNQSVLYSQYKYYTMKSKAAQRFNQLHPASHADFQNLLKTARKRKNSPESSEEILETSNQEVSNMIKNKVLTKFTEEDQVYCEAQRKKRKLVSKNLTWSKNLIQVQIFLDCHYFEE